MPVRSTLNDEEIMESLRSGAGDGFDMIFKEWHRSVYHYAFSIVKTRQEAEDITDECFIKIWERRKGFTSILHCKSYLYTCIRNACIDVIKQRKAYSTAEKGFGYITGQEENILPAEVNQDLSGIVQNALNALTPACNRVFLMTYLEKKTAQEVAEVLNIKVQTVKNHKQQGFSLLRKILSPLLFK